MATVIDLPRPAPSALSTPLAQLIEAVDGLRAQVAVDLPPAQALLETAVLLRQLDRLKAVVLTRVADVDRRGLHDLDGAPSTASWVTQQETGIDRRDVALARRLDRFPALAQRVDDGLGLRSAQQIAAALSRLRPHLDRPDGLIDSHDAQQVLHAVIVDGVLAMVCQARGGLDDTHPLLDRLRTELADIADRPSSALARLEAAFLVLAREVEPDQLTAALDMLVDATLPLQLQDAADRAHRDRGFTLTRNYGGAGWTARGDLDDECGELLHTVLAAAHATDPDNPTDTQAWAGQRADGADTPDVLELDGCAGAPRSRRQHTHDALKLALRALLDSAALGTRGKAVPHVSVTAGLDTLHGLPGALPATAGSGNTLPLRLVQHWLCDSALTLFVLSIGRRVIETSHTQRTLKAHERQAKQIETGGQCQGAGCTRGPATGHRLIPHHATPWAICKTTSLTDTVLLCEHTHHDLHSGDKTIRLKDGRYLSPTGWVDRPSRQPGG